ncbi:MAG TPA: hypothetical protein DCM27_06300 [Rhodospirillaceae bacterium]|nr:hypothetical protein [Rhodospirillaceae bacterium]
MDKNFIISEIKRTARENDGVALGKEKFSKLTGIKNSVWWGVYWRTWGEAIDEAGFSENEWNQAHDKEFLLKSLALLTRIIKKFPASVDLRMQRKMDKSFPSHNTFDNLGSKNDKVMALKEFVYSNSEFLDILEYLPDIKIIENETLPSGSVQKSKEGFVYLGMLKIDKTKRYKIGKTNLVERRNSELSLQLPEKLELVHYIKTDDMSGIESYWHRRFADKNTNGEWFNLSMDDIRAFKLRKFM